MNKLIPQWENKMTEDEAWDELERKQAKKWNTTDMAHRSGGLTVEQAEKESTLQEISDIGQEAHTDHPMRHWDRTCPACVAEAEKQEPYADKANQRGKP